MNGQRIGYVRVSSFDQNRNAKLFRLSPPGLGAENDHQAVRKSMSRGAQYSIP